MQKEAKGVGREMTKNMVGSSCESEDNNDKL